MLRRSSEAQAERKGGNKLGRDDVKHNGPYTLDGDRDLASKVQ